MRKMDPSRTIIPSIPADFCYCLSEVDLVDHAGEDYVDPPSDDSDDEGPDHEA